MTAGAALDRDHVAGYNCSFVPVDSPRSFDETMYILMCGTGVGFSVEYKYVNKLPAVPESFEKSTTTIVVEDSKNGWAKSYRELLAMLWAGQIPTIDVSKLYMNGTMRSWVHYIQLRSGKETQKEHREIALACADAIEPIFPMIKEFITQ